jgi:phosphoribosylanthranilate isomerase
MTWIKICGITNAKDALVAVDAGADALGFVFYDKSPRKTDADKTRAIVQKLPDHVKKIGVFVDEPAERIAEIFHHAGLTGAQLHASLGKSSADLKDLVSRGVKEVYPVFPAGLLFDAQGRYKGVHIQEPADQDDAVKKAMAAVILDSGTHDQPGGTGRAFDWKEAAPSVELLQKYWKLVVAGGLTAANVAEAIRTLHPWGVDVASGVEAAPGKKDPAKLRAFVKAAREAEKNP